MEAAGVADVTSAEVDAPQSQFLAAEVAPVASQLVGTCFQALRGETLVCFCDSEKDAKAETELYTLWFFFFWVGGKHFGTHFEMSALEFCTQEDGKEFRSNQKKQ